MALQIHQPLKIVVLGDTGSGKTSLMHRIFTGDFLVNPEPTIGVEARPLIFNSNFGEVELRWLSSGGSSGLRDAFFYDADGLIILFDITDQTFYRKVPMWIRDFNRVTRLVPIAICANKVDLQWQRTPRFLRFVDNCQRHSDIGFFEISVRNNLRIDDPFLFLFRCFFGPAFFFEDSDEDSDDDSDDEDPDAPAADPDAPAADPPAPAPH